MKEKWPVSLGIFLFLTSVSSAGRCDSLCGTVLPFLNLFDVQGDDACSGRWLDLWREKQERGIAFSFREEDLFRKHAGEVRLADFSRRSGALAVSLPVTRGKVSHHFQLEVRGDGFQYAGRARGESWSGELGTTGMAGQVRYTAAKDGNRLGLSVSWERDSGEDQEVRLEEFPHARDDRNMNRFFLDLLEPTFGRDIEYDWDDGGFKVEGGGVWTLPGGDRVGLKLRREDRHSRSEVTYTNSGSRQELRGRRRADLEQRWTGWRGEMAVEHLLTPRWSLLPELGFASRRWEGKVRQRDVPESAREVLLDLLELGAGEGRWREIDLKARGTWVRSERLSAELVLGWGRSTYSWEGEGTTPVLGFSLKALPISHRGRADLSGSVSSRFGGIRAKRGWRRFRLDVGAMAARAEVETRTRADAEMEFGLFVSPVRDVSVFEVDLYRLFFAPSARLPGSGRLEYQITQYLADLTERGKPRVKRPDEKTRGGTIHLLTLKHPL